MGYTAWEKVRKLNQERYGIDYPQQPEDYRETQKISNIEMYSISFVRDFCEELRFDKKTAEREKCEDSDGNSMKPGLIPFNMEKDNDRLCMERAIHRFMKSGKTEDAFDIYFCYLEMFVGKYGKSKKMIEMLAEFEMNSSSLLLKHRDHYSHSVYVFLLGLSIYYNSSHFRKAYFEEYGFAEEDKKKAAHHFLQYWGLTALFHDIGYPFELPFEQVKSYFGNSIKGVPFVSYKGVDSYIVMEEEESLAWEKVLGRNHSYKTITELFADGMAEKLEPVYGLSAKKINDDLLMKKAGSPDEFGGFMDHAFFSGILLYHQLKDVIGIDKMTENKQNAQSCYEVTFVKG